MARIIIHQQRGGAAPLGRQQPATDQAVAENRQIRCHDRSVEPVGEPLLQVRRFRTRDLHGMTNVNRIHGMARKRFLSQKRHRPLRPRWLWRAANEPASSHPQAQREHHRRRDQPWPSRAAAALRDNARERQFRRQRFGWTGREGRSNCLALHPVIGHFPRRFGVLLKMSLDDQAPFNRQLAVEVGMQVVLTDRWCRIAHLDRLIPGSFISPAASVRRARDRRDITVPMGMSSTCETSA